MVTKNGSKAATRNRITEALTKAPAQAKVTRWTFKMEEMVEAVLTLHLESTAALLVHRFGEKARREIEDKATGKVQAKKKNTPKDYVREYLEAAHVIAKKQPKTEAELQNAVLGIPAVALKAAMCRAASNHKEKLVAARSMFYIEGDGESPDGDKLIKIKHSPVRMDKRPVRGSSGSPISARPIIDRWTAEVKVYFDPDVIKPQELVRWARSAGRYVGLLEMRPCGKNSTGTMGTYAVTAAHAEIPQRADDDDSEA